MRDKIKKPIAGSSSKLNNHADWVDYMKKPDLTPEEKMEIIKLKSQAMEKKANYMENGLSTMDIGNQHDVNQLYMDSIKAKMALIEQM